MITIPDYEAIARDASERIAKEFADFKFKASPPRITSGMVRVVLEAAEHRLHLTIGTLPQKSESKRKKSTVKAVGSPNRK